MNKTLLEFCLFSNGWSRPHKLLNDLKTLASKLNSKLKITFYICIYFFCLWNWNKTLLEFLRTMHSHVLTALANGVTSVNWLDASMWSTETASWCGTLSSDISRPTPTSSCHSVIVDEEGNVIAIGFTFSWTCQSGGYGNSERENSFAQVVSDKLDEFVKSQGYEDRYVEGLDACDAFIRQLMHDVPVAQEYFF